MKRSILFVAIGSIFAVGQVLAQEPVTGVANAEVLFTPRIVKNPKDPTKTYTTSWFDMWRFVAGKADEHWDPATKGGF